MRLYRAAGHKFPFDTVYDSALRHDIQAEPLKASQDEGMVGYRPPKEHKRITRTTCKPLIDEAVPSGAAFFILVVMLAKVGPSDKADETYLKQKKGKEK